MGRTDARQIRISELVNWLPKQEEAWGKLFTHRYILYGGSRGPGKSYWLRWASFLLVLYWYFRLGVRDVTVGLFCETYPDLRDRQISKIKLEFPAEFGEIKETKERGLGFHFREQYGGGFIALRNLDDPSKYQSAEFAAIIVDELTKVTRQTFDILRGSLRWPGLNNTVFLAASNPGGVGHMWVKQLWIDRSFPPELVNKAHEFAFIRALPADNPHLTASYWEELDSLPEPLRSAWRDGDWSVFAGMAFPSWDANTHIVKPFVIPEHWPKWRGYDWGYASPACCLWFTRDQDSGRVYVYRELYVTEMTDRQQARMIRELTPPTEQVSITYADPSVFGRRHVGDVTYSTADEFANEGVPFVSANNDRIDGKRRVDRLLGKLPDGKPGLVIFNTCNHLIRTLPALPYDEHRPEDVDTDAEDHAYDALRYGTTNVNAMRAQVPAVQIDPLSNVHPLAGLRGL